MKKEIYTVSIEVNKPPTDVFHCIVQLSKWWPEEYVGGELRLNSTFIFKTGDGHYSKNKVIELEPNKKLVWLTIESLRKSDNFDWSGTKMTIELSPVSDNTAITFTYDGVVLENERQRLAAICDFCIKVNLFNFIEGQDMASGSPAGI